MPIRPQSSCCPEASNLASAQSSRLPSTPRHAFTLVELLTVIAIIGVLATLLMSGLTSAKKSAYQARCISNLHQLSLALDMYLDDHHKRSQDLEALTSARYLPDKKVLLCPADKTGDWAGLVEPGSFFNAPQLSLSEPSEGDPAASAGFAPPGFADKSAAQPEPLRRSYLTPLPWDDDAWNKLMRLAGSAGIAVCQLHGLGRPNPDGPSIRDYQGVILRAQRDGAVVKRKVFWNSPPAFSDSASIAAGPSSSMRVMAPSGDHPWQFFTDDPELTGQ